MPYALTFGLSLLLSLVLIPLVRRACLRWGQVTGPRQDRWASRPVAHLGGVGIFAAFAFSLLAARFFAPGAPAHGGLLAGSLVIFALGLYDDLKRLTPPAKLAGQILAAGIVVSFGYTTQFFSPRIPNSLLAQIPNLVLTFIWLVGITNAINLLDNMDGLAGGIALIAAGFLGYFFWRAGNGGLLLISLALAGSALGFLAYNFPPARIFMGDSGSQFLGFTLAALAIARQPQASNVLAVMGVPTLLFLLPILDTALVTFTRLLRGQSPAQGGKDHASHRLIAFGLSERQAVLALWAVALVSGVLAAGLESISYWFSLALAPLLVLMLALLTAYLGGLKVVSARPPAGSGRAITRIMLELTYRRRLLEVILDFFLVGITFYLAILAQGGAAQGDAALRLLQHNLPPALVGCYLAFFLAGIYRGVWRYVGVDDLLRFLPAVAGGVALSAAGAALLNRQAMPGLPVYLLFAIFLLLGLAATRSSFRVLDLFARQQRRPAGQRVLIWGAGDAGELALRWLLANPQLDFRPVGFLDDDPFKVGRQIHGVAVLGGVEKLEALLQDGGAEGLIIPLDDAGRGEAHAALLDACRRHGCWVRTLKLEFELVA